MDVKIFVSVCLNYKMKILIYEDVKKILKFRFKF